MNVQSASNLESKALRALAPSLERRRVRYYLSMVLVDIVMVLASFILAHEIYLDYPAAHSRTLEAQLVLPLYLTVALQQRVYSIHALADVRYAITRALVSLAWAAVLLIFVTFLAKTTADFSRVVFTLGMTISAMSIAASRFVVARRIARRWGGKVTNVLVIDAGGPAIAKPGAIIVSAQLDRLSPDASDPVALDRLGRYLLNMDRVIVSCLMEQRQAWAQVLRAAGVRGELVTDRLDELAPIALTVENGWRGLVVSTGPLGMRQRTIKRAFDTALSLAGLIVLLPLLVAVAVAIKLEDGGPVFFVQQRLGRGNRFFRMLKFRSMCAKRQDRDGDRSASRDDDRVTRVGRFIRRTSIDELPQLLNVLAGDMSLVGPRPHAIGSQAGDRLFWDIDRAYWHRHALKPGVTGLAQIRGYRGATDEEKDLTDRLGSDLEYIRDWSLKTGILIVLKTFAVIVHPRAY